jgi:hypothetical protein
MLCEDIPDLCQRIEAGMSLESADRDLILNKVREAIESLG